MDRISVHITSQTPISLAVAVASPYGTANLYHCTERKAKMMHVVSNHHIEFVKLLYLAGHVWSCFFCERERFSKSQGT